MKAYIRKKLLSIFTLLLLLQLTISFPLNAQQDLKVRTIILADMGNEADEEQQMIHMLSYCNEFKLEGLIAVSGKFLHSGIKKAKKKKVRPDLFHELITEYAKVRNNLLQHAEGWPTEQYLRSIVKPGTSVYGMKGVGNGKSTGGSNLILDSIKRNLTDGNIYICVNAGSNTLAQALWDLRNDNGITQADKDTIYERIYVFENGAQDNAGSWIAKNFPLITWYRSNHQTYAYGGDGKTPTTGTYCWEPFPRTAQGQHKWADKHIQNNHGALGKRFPDRFKGNGFMEGGGTIPWIGLVNKGLYNPWKMWWGGWSGRCSKVKHKNVMSRHKDIRNQENAHKDFWVYEADSEKETYTDPVHNNTFNGRMVPVWRFRRAMWNDFRVRMDWCIKPYSGANHNPIASLNGDDSDSIIIMNNVNPGSTIILDASGSSDPDGNDLHYNWWYYKEAGTYNGNINIPNNTAINTSISIPADADEKQLHVILEVRDSSQREASGTSDNPIPLFDYRRLVINVSKNIITTPPEVDFIEPDNNENFPEGSDVNVVVNATDPDGSGIKNVRLFIDNGSDFILVRQEDNPPFEWGVSLNDSPLMNMSAGEYRLKAVAVDNQNETGEKIINITIDKSGENQTPLVNAGPDQAITLPVNSVDLKGIVTDDGKPANILLTTWSVISGPVTVSFADISAAETTAVFSEQGTYVLRLSANDSELTAYDEVTVLVEPQSTQPGDGLKGEYFDNINLTNKKLTRIDPAINFNWKSGSPDKKKINKNTFSIRWTGQIKPKYSGEYTFLITSDNGRRLWINNQLIIDKWIDDFNITYHGKIKLQANRKYNIRLEYFENKGGANIKFEWQSPGQPKQVVPQSQLYSE